MRIHTPPKTFTTSVVGLVLLPLLFSFAFLATPHKAQAQVVPVHDAGVATILGGIAVTEAGILAQQTLFNNAICAKEVGPLCIPVTGLGLTLDGLGNFLAKQAASLMINSVTNWVKNGFQGSPAFVTDFKLFLEDLAVATAVDVAGDLLGADVCNFFPDISLDVLLSARSDITSKFQAQLACTIDDIVADAQGFFSDFTSGEWIAFEASLEKNNNPFGLYISAQEELSKRTAEGARRETTKLEWGRGFFTFEDEDGNTKTPGAMIADSVSEATGYDLNQLQVADELDELVAAVLSQLLSNSLSNLGFI